MPELLIFAYDHPTADPGLSTAQKAALPSLFDLITVQADGWNWGSQELAHPWFRVLAWPQADMSELEALLSPKLPKLDSHSVPMTLWQYRGNYLNSADPAVQAVPDLVAFWGDTARTDPKFFVPSSFTTTVAALTVARADIADPNYTGTGT